MKIPKRRTRRKTPAHRRAPEQEKAAARRINGMTVKGSGSGFMKGDARRIGLVRIECKTTRHMSYRIRRQEIEKLEAAVFGAGEIPVMEIELDLGKTRFYIVPAWAMDDLLDRLCGDGDATK